LRCSIKNDFRQELAAMLRTKLFVRKVAGWGTFFSEVKRGRQMTVREILSTCSNPHVASAAVLSIGGDFARRFERDAAVRNLSSGALASRLVRHFACRAEVDDWEGARAATRHAETPILDGLRYILERGIELDEDDDEPVVGRPARPGAHANLARNCTA
jgi:hypothetical protein